MDSVSRPLPIAPPAGGFNFRARLGDLRDTAVVLAIHLAFRAALILRHWNY
jgi:hypothetical protein